mgnify:CR=1 FL=1|tara:strand:+ start:120 stop:1322 length:1203 start_codon:yes stop_codon:yes gene_type:complete
MKKLIFSCLATLLLFFYSSAQNTEDGSIAFTSFNADGTDVFSFIVLKEIPPNVSIFFTDNEWGGSSFNDNSEGTLEWTNTSTTAPGTLITITGTSTSDVGSVIQVNSSFNLSGTNEAMYAYTGGYDNPEFFLAAISNEGYSASVGLLTGTGLIEGTTATNLDSDEDIGVLNVVIDCTGDDRISCATKFNTVSDWITQDGGGDQSNDGTAPDVPDDILTGHIIPTIFGILPVEFSSFEAEKTKEKIKLAWKTASEINNDRFDIERSTDAVIYETIGAVKGNGNSLGLNDYTFVDESPLTGINYYRLKQIDIDGRFEYSDMVSVEMDRSSIRITPTSTYDFVIVSTGAESSIILRSVNGQVMNQQSNSEGNFTVEMAHYPQGIYFLTINMNGSIQTEKVVRL